MCMTNRIAAGAADPLAGLIARVVDDLKQRTAAGLADGAMLEGDGWRLADMQFLFPATDRGNTTRIHAAPATTPCSCWLSAGGRWRPCPLPNRQSRGL